MFFPAIVFPAQCNSPLASGPSEYLINSFDDLFRALQNDGGIAELHDKDQNCWFCLANETLLAIKRV